MLGCVALYASILTPDNTQFGTARRHITASVDELRHAGVQRHVARSLLARAWVEVLTSGATAVEDLNEAFEIAERGPMRLRLADAHLQRARLFYRTNPYPWQSPRADLAAARGLIERCGYWRRQGELEDAERVILSA
jgi:hypothetical protein